MKNFLYDGGFNYGQAHYLKETGRSGASFLTTAAKRIKSAGLTDLSKELTRLANGWRNVTLLDIWTPVNTFLKESMELHREQYDAFSAGTQLGWAYARASYGAKRSDVNRIIGNLEAAGAHARMLSPHNADAINKIVNPAKGYFNKPLGKPILLKQPHYKQKVKTVFGQLLRFVVGA